MRRIVFALLAAALTLLPAVPAQAATERAVFAGGCFWGMQAVFESLRGVSHVVAGFAGGSALTAHYEIVSTGTTGHAESVEITFDPAKISYQRLLDVYFLVAHDPTELNRQGPDDGPQYRSEIFYTSDAQRDAAQAAIASLERRRVYSAPVVTKLERYSTFFPAESYHQDYLVHNPQSEYIVYNDIPKLKALESKFPQLVNRAAAPLKVADRS